jgi:hypothetical protein
VGCPQPYFAQNKGFPPVVIYITETEKWLSILYAVFARPNIRADLVSKK